MAVNQIDLGNLPVYVGDWVDGYNNGSGYSIYNIVTYYGSAFISTVSGNKLAPCEVELDDRNLVKAFTLNAGWKIHCDSLSMQVADRRYYAVLCEGSEESPIPDATPESLDPANYVTRPEFVALKNQVDAIQKIIDEGGVTPTPTEKKLVNVYYYGGSDTKFVNDGNLRSRVMGLPSTDKLSVNSNFNKVYHYIAIASDQTLSDVVAVVTQEHQTELFTQLATTSINGITYKVLEYTLDSGIPLDMQCTIKVTGTTK